MMQLIDFIIIIKIEMMIFLLIKTYYKNNFKFIINKLGYCHQYDAIFEYLTVYENLEFYSQLKGVKEECMDALINALIKEMRLQEFTNKISGRLSVGNKRKLSVAISMLCNPLLIFIRWTFNRNGSWSKKIYVVSYT